MGLPALSTRISHMLMDNSILSTVRVDDSHCRLKSDTEVVRERLNIQFNSQQGQKSLLKS